MAHYNPRHRDYQHDKYEEEKVKNPITALILTLLFGPIGLFYVTALGGCCLTLVVIFFKDFQMLTVYSWPVSVIWAVIATNRPLKTKFEQMMGSASYQEQDLPLYPLEQTDTFAEENQGLNRKAPHTRHFFAYNTYGVVHTGLKPDYSPFFNTVIRPDIDVAKDIEDINNGHGVIPKDHLETIKKFRNREFIQYGIALLFTLPFIKLGIAGFLVIFVTFFFTLLIVRPFKSYAAIEALEFEANKTEWLVNGRVYGEQFNEIGQNVLYPKRGDGFYPLTGLDYLTLYALQFHKGNTEKSDTLYQNLLKGYVQYHHPASRHVKEEMQDRANAETNRTIGVYAIKLLTVFAPKWVKKKKMNKIVEDPQLKIRKIYDECSQIMPLDLFI
jgi:hypothetical protein